MEQILLVSTNFIKNVSNIDENLPGKLLNPAIFEAQNEGLRGILGDALEDKLENLVNTGEIELPANINYKKLLLKAQYFIAYTAIANVCMLTTVKVSSAGLEQVSDEHMQPLSMDDSFRLRQFYLNKADYLAKQMQNYILRNITEFPEVNDCDGHSIKSNLHSSASTGIWLGGVRGRGNGRGCGCHK